MTNESERAAFEKWYVENAFDYEANPIGSRECSLQWSAWRAAKSVDEAHQDDIAVDEFAIAMKEKLAIAREKGRSGWNDKTDCSQRLISNLLRAHVEKGDPIDVANFCMFLQQRGESILRAHFIAEQEKARVAVCYGCGGESCKGECGYLTEHGTVPVAEQEKAEAVAVVEAREPYLDGSANPMKQLNWSLSNCENDLPVGTKLYLHPAPSTDRVAAQGGDESSRLWSVIDRMLVDAWVLGDCEKSMDMLAMRKRFDEALRAAPADGEKS